MINIFLFFQSFSQVKGTIYCFPGQGFDKRIFDSLTLVSSYKIKIMEYATPGRGMTMNAFAKELAKQIDTTEEFILMGVSLGGMLCVELNEMLHPKKTILISSAKNRKEFPWRYRFQKAIPIYKLFPGCVLKAGAKMLQPLFEPDKNMNRKLYKSMLSGKSSIYMKRTVNLIMRWERKTNTKPVYHIHGTSDHTLPFRKIKSPDYIIKKGSHLMTLTRAREISEILNKIIMQ